MASQYHSAGEIDSVTADLDDDEAVRRAVQGCDAVMHLAAMADVNEVLSDPVRAERVNVRGTHGLLEAIRAEETGRFLYASTVWVYGNAVDEEPIGEDMPLSLPPHFYTATKLAGEMYCSSYQALYGVASTILRFGIPYGPRAPRRGHPGVHREGPGRGRRSRSQGTAARAASSSTSRTSPRGW